MKKLLILGAGGHGKVIADCAQEIGIYDGIAFLDDDENKLGASIQGIPVVGKLCDFNEHAGSYTDIFAAVGNNRLRAALTDRLTKLGCKVPCLIHPRSYVSRFSSIQSGTVVLAGAVVNTGARLGAGNIINTCASVDHDCVLGDGVHISPGARLGGSIMIGDYTWVCIGASVANNVYIGKQSIIAAGAAVIHNIENNVLAAGVPAVEKKRLCNDEEEDLFIAASYERLGNAVHKGGYRHKLDSSFGT